MTELQQKNKSGTSPCQIGLHYIAELNNYQDRMSRNTFFAEKKKNSSQRRTARRPKCNNVLFLLNVAKKNIFLFHFFSGKTFTLIIRGHSAHVVSGRLGTRKSAF